VIGTLSSWLLTGSEKDFHSYIKNTQRATRLAPC
jgi:hypothetical protein